MAESHKLDTWPSNEGLRPKSGKLRLNLHGTILEGKSIGLYIKYLCNCRDRILLHLDTYDHDEFLRVQRWLRFAFLDFIFFTNYLCCCKFILIFRIWVKIFVCKLSILFLFLLGGCLCNFSHARKLRNKEKEEELVFGKEKIKKTTLEHPLLSFPSLFSCAFFFSSTSISNKDNFNIQISFESQSTMNT